MVHFVNRRENIVAEAIDGLIAVSGGKLARLDGYPHIRVVVRTDCDKSRVALVSGGGAGHEPSHAGFVGKGMLAAAVCGDVFASPSVDAVLAGILAVTGSPGCLLIVKNYTGDRLNFGLAAQRARALGLKVSMVIVDDDISLPELSQARGIAGTLFVHKIAGALAESGRSLTEVTEAAQRVIASTQTIGMSLDTCTLPGAPKEDRIPAGRVELGLGIHGEAGVEQIGFVDAKGTIAAVVEHLLPHMSDDRTYVALLNNLGGTSVLEMQVLAHELARSAVGSKLTFIVGPASMMTALDMHGFSVSVCAVDKEARDALIAPVSLSAWPGLTSVGQVTTIPLPGGLKPLQVEVSDNPATRALIELCCNVFLESEVALNALDAKAGDGDTGSTLAGAARALIASLDRLPLNDPPLLLKAISQELSQTMGGSSGVLLAILFAAAGDASATGVPLPEALKAGLARMQEIGGARRGDRTMVDALGPAFDALDSGIVASAVAAREGADRTGAMLSAKAGRSTYINADQLRGNVDPGAEAVARLFDMLAREVETPIWLEVPVS